MNSFLLHLLAVASSIVLAMPPGLCSSFMQHDGAKPARAQAKCCPRTAPDEPSSSEKSPAPPSIECCCTRDATLPEKSIRLNGTPDLAPVLGDQAVVSLGWQTLGKTVDVLYHSGPPLHVLKCVWRC